MIQKANRIALLEEGAFQGWARALNIVGPNFSGALGAADIATITWSGRELLTANRTYYVRTDGSDSNTGLANSSGGAFATIQKAINVIAALDISTFTVTIQLGNTGNYAGWAVSAPFIGGPGSSVSLIGDTSAPGSYVITSSCTVQNNAVFQVSGVDFTPSSGDGMAVVTNGYLAIVGACHFGTTTGSRQLLATTKSIINIAAVLTVNGNAANWILAVENSVVSSNGIVHVFSGTPAFSAATVQAQTGASIAIVNGTPSGAATGKRYDVSLNAVLFTNGGGASFIPGNSAGSTATGGQYA